MFWVYKSAVFRQVVDPERQGFGWFDWVRLVREGPRGFYGRVVVAPGLEGARVVLVVAGGRVVVVVVVDAVVDGARVVVDAAVVEGARVVDGARVVAEAFGSVGGATGGC